MKIPGLLRPTRVLLVICLVISCLIAWGMPFPNEDLFLGFCSGKAVLNGQIGAPDQWAFTLEGRTWVDQSWLSHLIYYISFVHLAYLGPVLIKGLLTAACTLMLYLTCRALEASPEVSILSVTLGVLSFAPFLKIRGENFGMLLFVVMSAILSFRGASSTWRQAGSLAVLAVWSNCHGSFMLGFFLMGLRFGADVIYAMLQTAHSTAETKGKGIRPVRDETGNGGTGSSRSPAHPIPPSKTGPDVLGWGVTLVLAVGVMAFANPYGPENLIIPFNQIGEKTVTAEWVDWRPLIHPDTIFSRGVFKPLSVIPFLFLLGITAGLSAFLAATAGGIRKGASSATGRTTRLDPLMVVLIPALLFPLVFRFQRMIIFAAPAMVPLLALLIQACIGAWEKHRGGSAHPPGVVRGIPIPAILACLFLATICFIFYRSVVILHLPGNPLTYQEHDPPLFSRLMSRNFMRDDAVRFLNENHIGGRVFTNVVLSGYLVFHVPNIRTFFDLRAQSVFPERIIKDYLTIVTPGPGDIDATIDLLGRNRMDLVILDTSKSMGTRLADQLMQTAQWGCIYADEWVIILAAASSPRFGPMIRSCNLDGLTYNRPETKTQALGLLTLFMRGTVSPDLLDRIIALVKEHPRPQVYSLVIRAMNGSSPCLNSGTKAFLESEAARLAGSDYLVSGGAFGTLRSLLEILVILEKNEIGCLPGGNPRRFTEQRRAFMAAFDDLRRQYGGF
ncbi:MAG: hypothetical protein V1792_27155 [Pseudomonadota bacterium]